MDKRWRNRVTVAFLAVTVLVIAMMLSGTLHRTPRITLPSGMQAAGQTVVGGETPTVVEVTPETVQTAVATLSRPLEYRRTVTVEQLWTGGSGTYETAVAVSGGWTRTDRTLAGGRVRHVLTDGEVTHIWYDGGTDDATLRMMSGQGKEVIVLLPNDDEFLTEMRAYLKIERFLRKNSST